MAAITAGRRSRPAGPLPVRWLAATVRNTTFVVAGIPLYFAALLALALPWTGPWSRTATWPWFLTSPGGPPIQLWQVTVALVASIVLLLLIRVPLTASQRHRCWSLLGIDIPRTPEAGGILALRPVTSLRAESAWRQLGYHLVVGPALALLAMLTLAAWALGLAFAAAYGYASVFPTHSAIQALSPKEKILLTVSGCLLLLLAGPALAAITAWLDRRAAAALLGPSRSAELERRVETLSESRAGVVDAADAERRRIERDLHDGAQQRLVSLAMTLGMARENLTDLPPEARQLIESAHTEAKEALTELRNLVRGLHPAVLEDRGLDAALSGIAARAPLPVQLRVDMPGRASPTVEAVAYFVVSECLANISRHSGASQAEIDVRLAGRTLRIRVTDNGTGGADPSRGSGLASLAQRARSVDGSMHIESPAGGPTVITVELPCGS